MQIFNILHTDYLCIHGQPRLFLSLSYPVPKSIDPLKMHFLHVYQDWLPVSTVGVSAMQQVLSSYYTNLGIGQSDLSYLAIHGPQCVVPPQCVHKVPSGKLRETRIMHTCNHHDAHDMYTCPGFDSRWLPWVFFFVFLSLPCSWLTNVDGMKDLWCSSTVWLLSTQI